MGRLSPPPPLPSPPSAYGCLYRMAIPPLCLSPSVKSPRWEEIKTVWKNFQAVPKNWLSPAPPNSSFIILRKTTGPRPSWTGTLRAAWRSAWGRLRPDTQYDYKFVGLIPQYPPRRGRRRRSAGGTALRGRLHSSPLREFISQSTDQIDILLRKHFFRNQSGPCFFTFLLSGKESL